MSPCHSTGFIERLSLELRREGRSPFAIKGDGATGERVRERGSAPRKDCFASKAEIISVSDFCRLTGLQGSIFWFSSKDRLPLNNSGT
jgi:hypothetical protein